MGDVVATVNLPGPKGPRVRQMFEPAGAELLYLPPDCPDFNPIENVFAKPTLKALLRKAAERTVKGLWTAAGKHIGLLKPQECQNLLVAAATMHPGGILL
jgi:transposase